MRKILGAVLLGAAAAATMAVAPAQASLPNGVHTPGQYYYVTPCAGHLIKTVPLKNERDEIRGTTHVYYSSKLNGVVCAMTFDGSRGKYRQNVSLKRGNIRYAGTDSGLYNTYAGGIAVPNSNGRCFAVRGSVSYGSGALNQYSGNAHFCKPGRL